MAGKSAIFFSKSAIKKAIKKGLIKVDNLPTTTATFVKARQSITILQDIHNNNPKQFIFPLKVVFEDEYLAIIEKPPGILVSGNSFKTVDNALTQNLQRSALPDACRPRPVHRLDFPTTGLLLVGKTTTSIAALNHLFEEKKIEKKYLAISIGEMENHGSINEPIDGKFAQSNYHKLTAVKSERFDFLNLLLLQPITGRRHQLRKHLAAIGHEILGEREYGNPKFLLKGKGLYLHAFSLAFKHPITGSQLQIQSEIPERFQKIIGKNFII